MTVLVAPDPNWPAQAQNLGDAWRSALPGLVAVHHIGSTSVPGLPAKPVIDLLPVFESTMDMDAARPAVEALGYEWLGDHGLPGRRYARRDTADGTREVQAHCYPVAHADIARHLAFRDALRASPALRAAYTAEKARCAVLHPGDPAGYGACKSPWIEKAEARALEHFG